MTSFVEPPFKPLRLFRVCYHDGAFRNLTAFIAFSTGSALQDLLERETDWEIVSIVRVAKKHQ
ncbi:MAG: hypothetical protein AAF192_01190 [Pseudomonadota bacterium]